MNKIVKTISAIAIASAFITLSACRDDGSSNKTVKEDGSAKTESPAKADNAAKSGGSGTNIACENEDADTGKACSELTVSAAALAKFKEDCTSNNGKIVNKCPGGASLTCKIVAPFEGMNFEGKFNLYKDIAEMAQAAQMMGQSVCVLMGMQDI
ncbi:MAG: hypothetical protein FWH22_09170 [Fibromonadales bacterium]|nr:hypothetical protein [Fibromonadales bacterium]